MLFLTSLTTGFGVDSSSKVADYERWGQYQNFASFCKVREDMLMLVSLAGRDSYGSVSYLSFTQNSTQRWYFFLKRKCKDLNQNKIKMM